MNNILIVDGSSLCRELLAKALEASGYGVSCAKGSTSATDAVASVKPDLVIIDPATDCECTRFLESLHRSAGVRVIVLTDLVDKQSVLRAGQLGVRDYMLKHRFSLAELLIRVQKNVRAEGQAASQPVSLAAAPEVQRAVPPASTGPQPKPAIAAKRLSREQTMARVESGCQAKTLPGAVTEIMALVNSPRGAIADVAQALKRDPVLAARVLQIANSAAFISQKPRIASIEEAVRNIGIGGVRGMILSVGVFECFSGSSPYRLDILRFWQHSFAVAAIMERLVQPSDAAPAGSAHLVGLCHDLADLALAQQFPEEYAAAAALAEEAGQSLAQARSAVFGMPYHELAVALLRKLGLPPVITVPIEEVIERSAVRSPGAGSILARALRIANVYANGLMLPSGPEAYVTPLSASECRGVFGTDPPAIDDFILRSEALAMVNMLSGIGSREATNLCKAPLEKSSARVWYARHGGYGAFDPLEASLHMAGDVQTHAKPPVTAAELEDCDIIVVAAPRQANPLPSQQQIGDLLKLSASRPTPILYLSGSAPQALSAGPLGRCLMLPVLLPQLVEALSWCVSRAKGQLRSVAA